MNFEEGLQTLDTAVFSKTNRHLSDAERIILQSSWQGLTYEEIADSSNHYTAEYLRQFVGFNLWRLLSEILGEKVSKTNFRAAIEVLAQRHELDYNPSQLQQLISMVGGHPYLIILALYRLAVGDITLESFLQNAPTNAGIYEAHLRRILNDLQINSHLAEAFMQVVTATEPVSIATMPAYQLYSMGLVKRVGDKLVPRCQLYQQYFREHL